MKMIEKYESLGIASEDDAFNYLINNLKDTIHKYDFFVAWEKVLGNVSQIEVSLNILNSLIGKDDISNRLKKLIKDYPEVVSVIPVLIAVREKKIKVAGTDKSIEYSFAKKTQYSDEEIEKIVLFAKKCGLLKILSDKSVKNLVDYCIGVEVGLDTNARKNRSGTSMERLSEFYIKSICDKHGFEYLTQATVSKIKNEFGKDVPTDKADRHFDFVVNTKSKIYLLEVNYYSGGGSKLKSVAGEFKSLYELISTNDNIGFIWITDGVGWETAKRPLLETFTDTDYVMNINMIENGCLEEIFTRGL